MTGSVASLSSDAFVGEGSTLASLVVVAAARFSSTFSLRTASWWDRGVGTRGTSSSATDAAGLSSAET